MIFILSSLLSHFCSDDGQARQIMRYTLCLFLVFLWAVAIRAFRKFTQRCRPFGSQSLMGRLKRAIPLGALALETGRLGFLGRFAAPRSLRHSGVDSRSLHRRGT